MFLTLHYELQRILSKWYHVLMKGSRQNHIFLVALLLLTVALFVVEQKVSHTLHPAQKSFIVLPERMITIGDTVLTVEIARTREEHEIGLSNRPTLPQDHGMLFLFDHQDTYQFWMPHMYFALDMVWFGNDRTIVDITHDATPESFPNLFEPKDPARYVLEVPAGYADLHGWKEGMLLTVR